MSKWKLKITKAEALERLAHAVQKYKALYNKTEKEFKDKIVNGLAWAHVAKETGLQSSAPSSRIYPEPRIVVLLGVLRVSASGYDDDVEGIIWEWPGGTVC